MTNHIRGTAELSIDTGKLDECKKMVNELIERVKANEPNTLSYEWFFNEDESKCYLLEWYKDSEALQAHLENVGVLLGPLLEIAPLTELMIYGDPSDELRQAIEPFGAKFYKSWHGVTR